MKILGLIGTYNDGSTDRYMCNLVYYLHAMDLGKTSRFTYAMAASLPKFLPNEFAKVSLLALEDVRRF